MQVMNGLTAIEKDIDEETRAKKEGKVKISAYSYSPSSYALNNNYDNIICDANITRLKKTIRKYGKRISG